MSRANPFGDLDDFTPQPKARPITSEAIEELAKTSGFPSRKAASIASTEPSAASVPRQQRRHTTGRNRQINIKATAETITRLYRIADERGMPLGAILEAALESLERK